MPLEDLLSSDPRGRLPWSLGSPPGDYSAPFVEVGSVSESADSVLFSWRFVWISLKERCGSSAAAHWLQWNQVSPFPLRRTAWEVFSVTWNGPVHLGSDHFLLMTLSRTHSTSGGGVCCPPSCWLVTCWRMLTPSSAVRENKL